MDKIQNATESRPAPPLPPLYRKLRLASLVCLGVLCCAVAVALIGSHFLLLPGWIFVKLAWIAVAMVPLLAALSVVLFFYSAFFVTRFRLLELQVAVALTSLPIGWVAVQASAAYAKQDAWQGLVLGLAAAATLVFAFAGCLWGVSAAQRLSEERTPHRLGLMLLGMALLLGISFPFAMGVGSIEMDLPQDDIPYYFLFTMLAQVLYVPVGYIEYRCWKRAKAGGR